MIEQVFLKGKEIQVRSLVPNFHLGKRETTSIDFDLNKCIMQWHCIINTFVQVKINTTYYKYLQDIHTSKLSAVLFRPRSFETKQSQLNCSGENCVSTPFVSLLNLLVLRPSNAVHGGGRLCWRNPKGSWGWRNCVFLVLPCSTQLAVNSFWLLLDIYFFFCEKLLGTSGQCNRFP